jgi:tetratricopeptide (TPR) repeat protein
LAKKRVTAQTLKRDPLMEQFVTTTSWVKGHSNPILTWMAAAAAAISLILIVWWFFSSRADKAADVLATGFRYHNAIVQNPLPANLSPSEAAFTTEDEKHRKTYEAFEKAAGDYPSYNGEIGRFMAATHQLFFEPEKAEATLKELSVKDSETGARARLALAQRYEATGKYDEAIAEYQKLKSKPYNIPLALIDINIAKIYEKQGKNKEAVDLYFSIASNKDWRNTQLGSTATDRLTELAPEKVDQLPPPEPGGPFGN